MAWNNMKVTPTKTGVDGTGYYRGEDGRYYYGNKKYGLRLTREEQEKDRIKEQNRIAAQNNKQTIAAGVTGAAAGGSSSLLATLFGATVGALVIVVIVSIAIVGFIINIINMFLFGWPHFLGVFFSNLIAGSISWEVLLITGALLSYFIRCVRAITKSGKKTALKYLLICTSSLTILYSSLSIAVSHSFSIIEILSYAMLSFSLAFVPSLILLYIQNAVRNELYSGSDKPIIVISKKVSSRFIGNYIGLIIFGIIAVCYGAIEQFSLLGSDAIRSFLGINSASVTAYILGAICIIMGKLAKKQ